MKNILYTASLLILCLALSSWGSKGHRKISQNMAGCLPARISFLKPSWTNFVANHASDADYRKSEDPNEEPRHYIDIDNYQEFVQNRRIPQTYDSIVAKYGAAFVIDQGILPWSTLITFDSLKNCFQRGDWNRSAYFAADLGHYVGDGHMPLHITRNYNGQMTGQTGVHSRYETTLISRYETQIVYPVDSAHFISNVGAYVFQYLYEDYKYVDSVLISDTYATTYGGATGTDAYYQALWAKSGDFTKRMMRTASTALADLIYTAWVQAGSPMMYPNAIDETETSDQAQLLQVYPNPATDVTWFRVAPSDHPGAFRLEIYDMTGKLKDKRVCHSTQDKIQSVRFETAKLMPGTYLCVLKSGDYRESRKFVVKR
jgi:hypothetical protein